MHHDNAACLIAGCCQSLLDFWPGDFGLHQPDCLSACSFAFSTWWHLVAFPLCRLPPGAAVAAGLPSGGLWAAGLHGPAWRHHTTGPCLAAARHRCAWLWARVKGDKFWVSCCARICLLNALRLDSMWRLQGRVELTQIISAGVDHCSQRILSPGRSWASRQPIWTARPCTASWRRPLQASMQATAVTYEAKRRLACHANLLLMGNATLCTLRAQQTFVFNTGWASVGQAEAVHPMVMSIGFNPFYANKVGCCWHLPCILCLLSSTQVACH